MSSFDLNIIKNIFKSAALEVTHLNLVSQSGDFSLWFGALAEGKSIGIKIYPSSSYSLEEELILLEKLSQSLFSLPKVFSYGIYQNWAYIIFEWIQEPGFIPLMSKPPQALIDEFFKSAGLSSSALSQFYKYSHEAWIWKVTTKDGKKYTLKIYPYPKFNLNQQMSILKELANTSFPIPKLIHFENRAGFAFIISEWIEGESLTTYLKKNPQETARLAEEFGRWQAHLHSLDIKYFSLAIDNLWIKYIQEEWINTKMLLTFKTDALCHFDFQPNNIIVNKGQLVACLDFTFASLADHRADLGITESLLRHGFSLEDHISSETRQVFEEHWKNGYAEVKGDFPLPPLFRLWGAFFVLNHLKRMEILLLRDCNDDAKMNALCKQIKQMDDYAQELSKAVGQVKRKKLKTLHPSPTAALILAAGESTRFGSSKALIQLESKSLIRRLTLTYAKVCQHVIVVTGSDNEQVSKIASEEGATVVFNTRFKEGVHSSLELGLAKAQQKCPFAQGIIISPVDLPLLNEEVPQALINVGLAGAQLAIPTYLGINGYPIWISSTVLYGYLGGEAASPYYSMIKEGINAILENGVINFFCPKELMQWIHFVPVDDLGVTININTPKVLKNWLIHLKAAQKVIEGVSERDVKD